MIRSFSHGGLESFWEQGSRAGIPPASAPRILRMLDALDAARVPADLNVPGYRFHELKGDRAGTFSITVTGNWRITFRWDGQDAIHIDYEDYH